MEQILLLCFPVRNMQVNLFAGIVKKYENELSMKKTEPVFYTKDIMKPNLYCCFLNISSFMNSTSIVLYSSAYVSDFIIFSFAEFHRIRWSGCFVSHTGSFAIAQHVFKGLDLTINS